MTDNGNIVPSSCVIIFLQGFDIQFQSPLNFCRFVVVFDGCPQCELFANYVSSCSSFTSVSICPSFGSPAFHFILYVSTIQLKFSPTKLQ